ncbi:hypothetical protein V1460_11450 [Streptomyces sp. SCSIO 30461]
MSILVLHKSNASRRGHLAKAAEYAKKNGDRLLLVVKDPTWEKEFADVVVSVDTTDIEATVAAVRTLSAAEPEPIRAVAAFVGHSVPAAAAVAADLGLPFVGEQVARTVRDKYAMREVFASGNVPQPVYGPARTLDEAVTQAARIGFPLVLKPLIDNDSGYFRRVDDVAELTGHFPVVQRGAWSGIAHNLLYSWTARTAPTPATDCPVRNTKKMQGPATGSLRRLGCSAAPGSADRAVGAPPAALLAPCQYVRPGRRDAPGRADPPRRHGHGGRHRPGHRHLQDALARRPVLRRRDRLHVPVAAGRPLHPGRSALLRRTG